MMAQVHIRKVKLTLRAKNDNLQKEYRWDNVKLTYCQKAASDEPPYARLANQLAPHLIYEDMNQEFPTSIFYDGNRDMGDNGLSGLYPNNYGRVPVAQDGNVLELHLGDTLYTCAFPDPQIKQWPKQTGVSDSGLRSVHFGWQDEYMNSPTGGWTITITDYPATSPDPIHITLGPDEVVVLGSTYDTRHVRETEVYAYSAKDKDGGWHYYVSYSSGYYLKSSLTEKTDPSLTAVYMHAYEGSVDVGAGVKHNMLGIQYWFYYPYHDDPEGANHQHDWWYFWVVYDTTAHGPSKVVYDFHHNLRAYDWTNSRVQKEDGFHTKVYLDAGGHRSLYAPGGDISVQLAMMKDYGLYTMLDKASLILTKKYGLGNVVEFETISKGGTIAVDLVFGAMIKQLGLTTAQYPWGGEFIHEGSGAIASWRGGKYQDWVSGKLTLVPIIYPADSYNGYYAADETNKKLKVESFQNWIWVAGVERNEKNYGDRKPDPTKYTDSDGQLYSTVHFTYSHPVGQNLMNVDNPEWWPTHYYIGGNEVETYVPWFSGLSQTDSKYLSTTELIWYWHAQDYIPTNSPSPSATTRYYDASG